MMKYIQELRGGDLYSLKVSVCHVFAVYLVLMFRTDAVILLSDVSSI